MKKIPSLFKRNYDGDRLVRPEVVEGCEWVLAGEGVATEKFDGTCCKVEGGVLYKRFDRKVIKKAKRRGPPYTEADCKAAPEGWEAAEDAPNEHTGHWPGWLPISFSAPEDRWHAEAWGTFVDLNQNADAGDTDGTYELVGPKVQGNPYGLWRHELWKHGARELHCEACVGGWATGNCVMPGAGPDFYEIRRHLELLHIEGVVWHHPDGRMCKIKRRDFGLEWPVEEK